MQALRTLLVSFLFLGLTAATLTGQQIASHFRSSLSSGSGVYLPTDANYTEETLQRWNAYNPPTYVVSVKPASEKDVQQVVQYARQNNLPFLATGGGHGYTNTLSALQGGIELDMGNFKNVSIDPDRNLMTLGGSVLFRDVTGPLHAAGKEIPVGTCSCIGFTGATLGGGLGPYSGLHGPISDSLFSAKMVSGTGELLHVSAQENADLFWGLKGAGQNFGAVVSLTYNVYAATNDGMAMNADMTFSGVQNETIWKITRSFAQNIPKELSIGFAVVYDEASGQIQILGNFIYAGPVDEGKKLIKPYLDLQPTNLNISNLRWNDIQDNANYGSVVKGCIPGGNEVPYSLNLYDVNVTNLVDAVGFVNDSLSRTPSLRDSIFTLALYSQSGFKVHGQDSSAFPYRDVVVYVDIDGFFVNSTDGPVVEAWGRQLRERLRIGSGREGLHVYTNLAHGDEGEVVWYTEEKLPRLKELKSRYDPHSLFSYYNPIASH